MSELKNYGRSASPSDSSVLLTPVQLRAIQSILALQVPQARVFAFGSRVNGNPRKYSDIDLAIALPRPLGLRKLRQLKDAFEDSDLPICVDIVDWCLADPGFKAAVEAQGMAALQQPA
jgi:uncharacterized protein